MKYCHRCLQPDTRPNTAFDESGICPACNYFEALQAVDWDERMDVLRDLLARSPKNKGQFHDCIIGVSGGKDSTRQALFLRDKFGVNPLLVCLSYPPEQVTARGVDNLSNLIELGFDVIVSAPAPTTWKHLKRASFDEFANGFRSTEMALFSCVPQIAIQHGIPLIFWGENPALQLGDMRSLGRNGYDGNNLRHLNTLSSGHQWMSKYIANSSELIPYRYPPVAEFDRHQLQIVYLGWFIGDWSNVNNATYSCTTGLKIRTDRTEQTGDLFGVTALDEDFTPVNQMIKFYKFGFGRVTDYCNEEIRLGRMTRSEGVELVEAYDGAIDEKYIQQYCDYLAISVNSFWDTVTAATDNRLFEIRDGRPGKRKYKVGVGL